MPQIFHRRSNSLVIALVLGMMLVIGVMGAGTWLVWWSPYMTRVRVALDQPVPFSHQHHHAGLGIDCRYCHTSVETSPFAGVPPTETCMTCHSQVWAEAPLLAPVRESWRTGQPLQWNRVHDMPDFVFFNHGIHVQKGIGCSTCHGPVDQMPLTWKEHSLYMKWCLECHRQPEQFIRPKEQVFNMAYQPPPDQLQLGQRLIREYQINTRHLTDCSICHR